MIWRRGRGGYTYKIQEASIWGGLIVAPSANKPFNPLTLKKSKGRRDTMSTEYNAIIDSSTNGNGRQMVSQIDDMGWYDFADAIQGDENLDNLEKVEILCKALRIKNR